MGLEAQRKRVLARILKISGLFETKQMTSSITPLGILFVFTLGVMALVLPKRYALIPYLACLFYIPTGQAVMIGVLHFYISRIILIIAWVRMGLRGDLKWGALISIDKVFVAWAVCELVLGSLLWSNVTGLVYRLGYAFDAFGAYFLFRAFLHEESDAIRLFEQLAILLCPLSAVMAVEKATGLNPFYFLGGISSELDEVRNGVVRSQGVFGHSILAGIFGATLIPYFLVLWNLGGRRRLFGAVGTVSALIIVVAAGSSGPVMAVGFVVIGMAMWLIRSRMKFVRRSLVFLLVFLAIMMKAPVWWAIAHINIFSGNTAWYRSWLIDQFFDHFSDWWLLGTRSTLTWGFLVGKGEFRGTDITNMFVRVGIDGGLLTLLLFILIIVLCFRRVGLSMRNAATGEKPTSQFTIWALGVALFAHTTSFFDVSYFDQNFQMWCMLLAIIASTSSWYVPVERPAVLSPATKFKAEQFGPRSRKVGNRKQSILVNSSRKPGGWVRP